MYNAAPIRHIRQLCTSASSASTTSISRAKSRLRSQHDPDKALQIYSSLSKDYNSAASTRHALDLTVRRLLKSHRFSDIENFIESQKNDPKVKKEPFLSTLILSYGRAGMFDHALRTYDQMDDLGTPRSANSFNALLNACNQSKLFDKVPQLFDEMPKKYGFMPDKVSYGILVKSFCEAGQPAKAFEIVKEAEEKGVEPTVVTFTTILDALYSKGKIDEAEKLWTLMDKKGCIDVAAYNVKIRVAHSGTPAEVNAVMGEMSSSGFKPDTVGYNYLMTCYFQCGMVKEAKEVFKGLGKNGCNPNSATFRTSIFHLCNAGDFEEGYKVFKESVKLLKIPDFNTLKPLVEGLVKKGKKKEAKGMIRTMKKKSPPNMLKEWGMLEENLKLTSVKADTHEAKEASA
ncbi:hypothetical protein L6164_027733 [Bauhinia variegata]|uniref:Uncharacterized protein n=1 Tax=Bauhinia variegata TaxID=167791 RepID=A0ACB9LUT5_BAUVA|nr:hypothetical protein L6164_027733 [Bauhinia variegata]